MNSEQIATEAITILSPFLAKGGEEIAKTAAKDLWDKVKSILNVRGKNDLAKKLIEDPQSERVKGQVELVVQEEIEKNSELQDEFKKLLEGVRQHQEFSSSVNQTGDNNAAVGGQIHNSSINITR